MKMVIPMAGAGKRMRPHTLTTPKPLIPIAGRSIVERLVRSIADMSPEPFEEVAFVVARHFGPQVEEDLLQIARDVGAKGSLHYQDEALGTAHAIYCAAPALDDRVVLLQGWRQPEKGPGRPYKPWPDRQWRVPAD